MRVSTRIMAGVAACSLLIGAETAFATCQSPREEYSGPQYHCIEGKEAFVTGWTGLALDNLEIKVSSKAGKGPKYRALGDADMDAVSRCIKLNNYWCIKQIKLSASDKVDFWEGSRLSRLGKPVIDGQGHAAFRHPVYSARAAFRQFRTYYYRDNLRTLHQMMCRYADKDDCNGGVTNADGSCTFGYNDCGDYTDFLKKSYKSETGRALDDKAPLKAFLNDGRASGFHLTHESHLP